MRYSKVLTIAFGLLVMFIFLMPQALADQWDRKTIVTFSGPVEVPGVDPQVLPAGKYVFKIFNSTAHRHIVQIFNENEDHVYTTILAIPNYRLKPTDESVISFEERPAGKPMALKAWFYPGMHFGQEFVYPKHRAIELAKEVKEPVLETPATVAKSDLKELESVPVEAVEPSGEIVEMTKVVEPPPASETAQVAKAAPTSELPKTASWLPLLGLAGIISLGAGFALRTLRRFF